ncbi:unnamed protein product [Phytophthora fragariaefolia]|uniref:Unnamed protein product n=1 Tax=Phytophthora fragariaefolia TaxID=1490495 RepID=A0A9W6YRG5_9STRA|nr:unnamed protein product [Phytophthora fragariaefolia]
MEVMALWRSGIGNFAFDLDPSAWDEKCITAEWCPSHKSEAQVVMVRFPAVLMQIDDIDLDRDDADLKR